ncbi:hypothetical protein WCLP8_2050008 [uncultured Gammaproteobacteria bacterium]
MRRMALGLLTAIPLLLGWTPARAQGVDLGILMLLAGPVSEAVQETILLIRRGDNFISVDSLVVACTAGASAGVMVGVAPALGFTATGIAAPVAATYVLGAAILSCGMALVGGAAGMGTARGLEVLRQSSSNYFPRGD